jgi:hypothetical protein
MTTIFVVTYFDFHSLEEFYAIIFTTHLRIREWFIWGCVCLNMMTYLINCVIKEAIDLFKIICNLGNKGKTLILWMRNQGCKVPSSTNQGKDREKRKLLLWSRDPLRLRLHRRISISHNYWSILSCFIQCSNSWWSPQAQCLQIEEQRNWKKMFTLRSFFLRR